MGPEPNDKRSHGLVANLEGGRSLDSSQVSVATGGVPDLQAEDEIVAGFCKQAWVLAAGASAIYSRVKRPLRAMKDVELDGDAVRNGRPSSSITVIPFSP